MDYKKGIIDESASLLDGLSAIDAAVTGIALVVDKEGRLEGVLVDGDIRRALLSGASLNDPVITFVNRNYVSARENEDRASVLDLMQARSLDQVPIIDEDRRLVGLHTMHELFGSRERVNRAVIMAGGKGTRLRPITENLPKPMVEVAGRPILERLVLHLVSQGVRHIYISVNYLSHIIEDHFGNGSKFACKIEYLKEDKPLGTGGALSLLPEVLEEPLLLMNGDLVMQANFEDMLNFHESGSYFATMGLRPYTHEVAFGCAQVENNQLTSLVEKPLLTQNINAGVYVLSPEAIKSIPVNTMFPITNLFERAIVDGNLCGAYMIKQDWIDIGEHKQLDSARGH